MFMNLAVMPANREKEGYLRNSKTTSEGVLSWSSYISDGVYRESNK